MPSMGQLPPCLSCCAIILCLVGTSGCEPKLRGRCSWKRDLLCVVRKIAPEAFCHTHILLRPFRTSFCTGAQQGHRRFATAAAHQDWGQASHLWPCC